MKSITHLKLAERVMLANGYRRADGIVKLFGL